MKNNNPVLNSLPGAQSRDGYGYGYGQATMDQPQFGQSPYAGAGDDRPMTIDDVVSKAGITLAVIVVFAVANFGIALAGNPGLAMILTFVGAIGGFITVLVHAFGKKYGSKTVTLIYAAFEGLFVGGFSLILSGWMVGGANAGAMIFQAILGTLGVFFGMLFVYKTGAIRVTPRFNRILTGAIVGVAVLALGNFLLAIFTSVNPLRDGGTLSIIFGVVCIVLAALSFLQDFDAADRLVRTGAPAKMAWGVALGLAVTVVWLYTEILRLLSYFNRN
ncbi:MULTISPECIES: Bax inhibitor-1/YccA family protein [unclassified Corynebacterium]|uniref:Bax inhibitor-1/YccA family protein n=1 Tax=unclassified Corynebacterium TaxID=2624378 RepID=UPI002A90BDFE|nr:Bax inhibitor-1/YccA family protein [Corynebacterium sp.]MDY5785779.1 Bax inhibitor-1/YccA family protein [Corynebacterium sp.]